MFEFISFFLLKEDYYYLFKDKPAEMNI